MYKDRNGAEIEVGDIVQIDDGSFSLDSNGVTLNGYGAKSYGPNRMAYEMPEKVVVIELGGNFRI